MAAVVMVLVAAILFGILGLLWLLDWLFPLTLEPWRL
jgi:preprotein translocase subunit SecE